MLVIKLDRKNAPIFVNADNIAAVTTSRLLLNGGHVIELTAGESLAIADALTEDGAPGVLRAVKE